MPTAQPKLWPPHSGENRSWPNIARTRKKVVDEYLGILQVLVDVGGRVETTNNAAGIIREQMTRPPNSSSGMSTRLAALEKMGWITRLVNGRRTLIIELVDMERTKAILPTLHVDVKVDAEPEPEEPEPDPTPESPAEPAEQTPIPGVGVVIAAPPLPTSELSEEDAQKVAGFLLKRVLETKTVGDYSLQRDHLETELKKSRREAENLREDLDAERRKASRLQAELANMIETNLALERNLHRALQAPARNGVTMEEMVGEKNFRELKRLMKEIPVSPASKNGAFGDH